MSGFTSITRTAQGVLAGSDPGGALSQFGESVSVQLTAAAQVTFVQGINSINFVTASMGAGASVAEVTGSAVLKSGTDATGSAFVKLRRGMKYRAGQGSVGRFTAIFGPPATNSRQLVGLANPESGFYFGRTDNNFGVFHVSDGARELREATITSAVATTTNVTVTLNGEAVTIPIAGGSVIDRTSWEISNFDYTRLGGGWYAEAFDGKIRFLSLYAGPRTGSFSITAGGSPIATFSTLQDGRQNTETFISQSQWNVDRFDGTGPSKIVLDHSKGNVYQIGFQYLGYGNTRFFVENPNTGLFQLCHMIKQANSRTTPVLRDPHVNGIWKVENTGASTGTFLSGTSGAIFTEGQVLRNIGPAFSTSAAKTGVTAEVPILSLRANRTFRNKATYGELDITNLSGTTAIGGASTRQGTIRIYKNLRLTGPVNFVETNPQNSYASVDVSATGFSAINGSLVTTIVIPSDDFVVRDLVGDNFFLAAGETLTVTVAATDSASFSVALSWFEDQ